MLTTTTTTTTATACGLVVDRGLGWVWGRGICGRWAGLGAGLAVGGARVVGGVRYDERRIYNPLRFVAAMGCSLAVRLIVTVMALVELAAGQGGRGSASEPMVAIHDTFSDSGKFRIGIGSIGLGDGVGGAQKKERRGRLES